MQAAESRSRKRIAMLAVVPSLLFFISIFVTLYVKTSLQTTVPSLSHLAVTTLVLVAPNLVAAIWALWMVHINWTTPKEVMKAAPFIYVSIGICAAITATLLVLSGFAFEEVLKQAFSSTLDYIVFRYIIFGSIYKNAKYMKVKVF